MKAYIVTPFLLLLSLLLINAQSTEKNILEPLSDKNVIQISLFNNTASEPAKQRHAFAPTSDFAINLINIPFSISFLIVQVHTYQYNVTLSYDELHLTKVSNKSVFGSNIGLYVIPNTPNQTYVFLRNDNVRSVEALIAVVPYTSTVPIPGGCNMEFDVEEAPYQKLVVNDAFITVDSQPASLPVINKNKRSCEKNSLEQDAYRLYLNEKDYSMESYFDAISKMITVYDIMTNSVKIPASVSSSPFRRIYSTYHGTGSVYGSIVTYGSQSAAYVPVFTYGCNYLLYPEGCQLLNDTLSSILCGLVLIIGILCIFLGHRFPQGEAYVIKTIFCCVLSYIIVSSISSLSTASNIGISMGVGVILIILLFVCSACTGINSSALVVVASCGFLCSSIVYFSLPDSTGIWENNWTFWSIYLSIALVMIIMLSMSLCITIGPLTAFLCAFLVILPIDYFAGSSLKYIIINVIRRLTVPGFNHAFITPPIQSKDISLIVFWIILAMIRITNEFCGNLVCFICKRNNVYGCANVPMEDETRPFFNHGHNARVLIFSKSRNRW